MTGLVVGEVKNELDYIKERTEKTERIANEKKRQHVDKKVDEITKKFKMDESLVRQEEEGTCICYPFSVVHENPRFLRRVVMMAYAMGIIACTFPCFTYSYRNTVFSQSKVTFSKCFLNVCFYNGCPLS